MIHVMRDGQQFGPYTIEDINAYLAQGTLLPTDQAWYEGAANWMPITEVPGVVHGAAPAPVVAEADPMAAANPEVAVAEAGAGAEGASHWLPPQPRGQEPSAGRANHPSPGMMPSQSRVM